jgi:hypothetical protein
MDAAEQSQKFESSTEASPSYVKGKQKWPQQANPFVERILFQVDNAK